ncbi:unnamed protein product [Strongylus vulgaris]|uniref:Uncharacterized protein n=1 Tax=Strongylus vulgaris TaxID=40348 RepID=A0A3P7JWL0_STRVU|nr:unnamed protein product [Strongylus vulgaris]
MKAANNEKIFVEKAFVQRMQSASIVGMVPTVGAPTLAITRAHAMEV